MAHEATHIIHITPQNPSIYSMAPSGSQNEAISDIVRDVVAKVAPEELPIVDWLTMLSHDQVVRRMQKRPRRREQLGFGLGEAAVLITPILWLALDTAAKQLMGEVVKATGKRLKAALRKIFGKTAGPAALPAMNAKQLEALHHGVIAAALEKGLPEKQAHELADALVSRIATGRTSEPPSVGPER